MPVVPGVLIALDQDRVTARDEKSGDGIVRQVVVEREGLDPVLVAQGRLGGGSVEARRRGGPTDNPALEELVEVTEGADKERGARDDPDWIALARAVRLGVRAARGEPRPGAGRRRRRRTRRSPPRRPRWARRPCATDARGDEDAEGEIAHGRYPFFG